MRHSQHHSLLVLATLGTLAGISAPAHAQTGAPRATLTGVHVDPSIAERLGADPLGARSLAAFATGLRAAVGGGSSGTEVVATGAAGAAQEGGPTATPVTVHLTWPEVVLPTPTGRVRTSVRSFIIFRFDVSAGGGGAWRQVASVPPTQHQADVAVTISPAVNGLLSVGLELQTLTFSTGTQPSNGPVVNNASGTSGVGAVSNPVRILTP